MGENYRGIGSPVILLADKERRTNKLLLYLWLPHEGSPIYVL